MSRRTEDRLDVGGGAAIDCDNCQTADPAARAHDSR